VHAKTIKARLTPAEAALIAVFGALWGLMEATLGATLKGMRLPLSGAILASLAVVLCLTGRYFVPRRGSILMMGGVAALLKIFSIGTVIIGPFFAILIESMIAEICCLLLGVNRLSYFIAGALVVSYTVLHPLITQGLLFGTRVYQVYWETAVQISRYLHLQTVHLAGVISLYFSLHALVGGLAGLFSYKLAGSTMVELKALEQSK